jgi:hypothetical protein
LLHHHVFSTARLLHYPLHTLPHLSISHHDLPHTAITVKNCFCKWNLWFFPQHCKDEMWYKILFIFILFVV